MFFFQPRSVNWHSFRELYNCVVLLGSKSCTLTTICLKAFEYKKFTRCFHKRIICDVRTDEPEISPLFETTKLLREAEFIPIVRSNKLLREAELIPLVGINKLLREAELIPLVGTNKLLREEQHISFQGRLELFLETKLSSVMANKEPFVPPLAKISDQGRNLPLASSTCKQICRLQERKRTRCEKYDPFTQFSKTVRSKSKCMFYHWPIHFMELNESNTSVIIATCTQNVSCENV